MLKQSKRTETRVYEYNKNFFIEIHLYGYESMPSMYEVWVWDDNNDKKMFCFDSRKRDGLDWDTFEKYVENEIDFYIEQYIKNY